MAKKTNEAWFGDSFNRDASIVNYCSASVDGAASSDFAVTKSISGINYYDDFAVKSDVSTIQDAVLKLQDQVEELRRTDIKISQLRNGLKTLRYKREVE